MKVTAGKEIMSRLGDFFFVTLLKPGRKSQFYRVFCIKRKAIQEDESGTLRTATDDQEYRSRKRQMLEKQSNIRLSMVDLTRRGILSHSRLKKNPFKLRTS